MSLPCRAPPDMVPIHGVAKPRVNPDQLPFVGLEHIRIVDASVDRLVVSWMLLTNALMQQGAELGRSAPYPPKTFDTISHIEALGC